MLCAYNGPDARSYPDYMDAATSQMLEAEPGGGPYDVTVAPGRHPDLAVPPDDGRWTEVPVPGLKPGRRAKPAKAARHRAAPSPEGD